MFATPERLYTVDQFEQEFLDPEAPNRLMELIEGELHEKTPTQEHGLIATNIIIPLGAYVQRHRLGRMGTEVRHRAVGDDLNSRLPDVSFTSANNPLVRAGSVPDMPDLAVEIKSPNDTYRLMRETAEYYLANGTRIVWLVYPAKQLVEVYRAGADVEILTTEDWVSGYDVIPGFEMPVANVFADPFDA